MLNQIFPWVQFSGLPCQKKSNELESNIRIKNLVSRIQNQVFWIKRTVKGAKNQDLKDCIFFIGIRILDAKINSIINHVIKYKLYTFYSLLL